MIPLLLASLSGEAGTPLSAGAAWLLGVAIACALIWSLIRERRALVIAWVRWIGIAALLLILVFAPTREAETPERHARPSIVLMVDTSESMGVGDASVGRDACSRWDAIAGTWLDPDAVARLEEVADVRIIGVDSRTRARTLAELQSARPEGEQTRLARALRTVLDAIGDRSRREPAGATRLVLLTDGIDTDAQPLATLADEAVGVGVRISAVVPGSERAAPDVSLVLGSSAEVVYAGQSTNLVVRLRESGFDGRRARVVVREGGPGGKPVYDRSVILERATDLWVPVTPASESPGAGVSLVEYVATVEPLEGERDVANNERRAFVRVTSERIRVCVFEARPYWDTKFFVQSLRDDPQIDLTVVHALGSERVRGEQVPRTHVVRYVPDAVASYEERLPEAPLDDDALAEFDVIVLGKGIELFFPSMEAQRLADFVTERGGSLVFLRGAPIQAREDPGARRAAEILDEVSPVTWGQGLVPGGPLELTDEGKRQRALQFEHMRSTEEALAGLPDVLATSVVDREKTLSVVWLRQGERGSALMGDGDAHPAAIAQMSIGRGRTLAVLSDGMWRWAFLPVSLGEHSNVYQAFWSRAIRWLALGGDFLPGQSVSLDVDRLTTRPGQSVGAIVRTRFVDREGFRPTLTHRPPGGDSRVIELAASTSSPSKLTGIVVPSVEGVHVLELRINPEAEVTPDVLTTRFAVYDDRIELLDTAARPDEVRALCEATGGELLGLDGVGEMVRLLEDERAAGLSTPARVPAWDSGWVFAAIVGLLGIEWIVRRRMGLA